MCPFKPNSCIVNYAKEKNVVSYASRGYCGITGNLEYVVPLVNKNSHTSV